MAHGVARNGVARSIVSVILGSSASQCDAVVAFRACNASQSPKQYHCNETTTSHDFH